MASKRLSRTTLQPSYGSAVEEETIDMCRPVLLGCVIGQKGGDNDLVAQLGEVQMLRPEAEVEQSTSAPKRAKKSGRKPTQSVVSGMELAKLGSDPIRWHRKSS
ncbi:hypothetical protein MMC30_002709 [Trapelia coarctata]|nr:hypothetical protein [Trapelia coarctata]